MNTLLTLSALLLCVPSQAQDWRTLAGRDSGVTELRAAVARAPEEWAELWKTHDAGAGRALPPVDFAKEMVVAEWGGAGEYTMRKVPIAAAAPSGAEKPASVFAAAALEKAQLALPGPLTAEPGALFDGTKAPVAANAAEPKKESKKGWAFVFRGGPTFTNYSNADITIKTPRIDAVLHDAQIKERNSMEWYRLEKMKARPFHFLDEPSNDFTFGLENRKKGYAVNFIARHPKILIVEQRTINQDVRVSGAVDGRRVDRRMALDDVFSHYRLTHRLMNYQLQLEKLLTVESKGGALTLAPGISAGVYAGLSNAGYAAGEGPDGESRHGIIGKSASASVRAAYELRRVSASVMYQWTKGLLDYPFLDGRASQPFNNRTVTFQLGVTLKK